MWTGQSPALPPPLPTEQASRPTPASPPLEGKYFIFPKVFSVVDEIEYREIKQNSNSRNNKICIFSSSFSMSKLQVTVPEITIWCFLENQKLPLKILYW